jgi:hypothetical protein
VVADPVMLLLMTCGGIALVELLSWLPTAVGQ